jgi:hypothetical protein
MGRDRARDEDFAEELARQTQKAKLRTPTARHFQIDLRGSKRFRILEHRVVVRKVGLLWNSRKNLAECVLDLSRSGARVKASHHLDPGTKVTLELTITKFQRTVRARARVRWCKLAGDHLQVGLKFEDLKDSEQAELRRLENFFTDPRQWHKE